MKYQSPHLKELWKSTNLTSTGVSLLLSYLVKIQLSKSPKKVFAIGQGPSKRANSELPSKPSFYPRPNIFSAQCIVRQWPHCYNKKHCCSILLEHVVVAPTVPMEDCLGEKCGGWGGWGREGGGMGFEVWVRVVWNAITPGRESCPISQTHLASPESYIKSIAL